jgi:hypothetical protein
MTRSTYFLARAAERNKFIELKKTYRGINVKTSEFSFSSAIFLGQI